VSKASPKQVFVPCYCHRLAQAREPSLSESGLIAQAKASSLSENCRFCVVWMQLRRT